MANRLRYKVFEREGNPFWPLPPDYADLNHDSKRLARLNAVRMQGNPELAVCSWQFFCDYYLKPKYNADGSVLFDPMFYDQWKPRAPFHNWMVHWFEKWPISAMAFPRGGGKTTNSRSYVLWKLVTNYQYKINCYVSKAKPFLQDLFFALKHQLAHNELLLRDFGKLKPDRGEGEWGADGIRLNNFSRAWGFSIDGKLRGPRANFNLIDDIDQDPETANPDEQKIEDGKRKILQVLIPMLDEGCNMGMIGTNVHQKSLLTHIVTMDNDELHKEDFDPRLASVENGGYWHKKMFRAKNEKGESEWAAKFTDEFLEQKRFLLGPSLYSAEYENNPRSVGAAVLDIHPALHYYQLDGSDPATWQQPFAYEGSCRWQECSGVSKVTQSAREQSWSELVGNMARGITVDVALGQGSANDYSVINTFGIDHRNDYWVLDLWAGKVGLNELVDKIWEYAIRWRVQIIGIESVAAQEAYFHQASARQEAILEQHGFVPQMVAIKPPTNIDKGQRIRGLEWRFSWGRIKLPGHRMGENAFQMLESQILNFTEDLANLKHDDCIDAVEMGQRLLKGQKATVMHAESVVTPEERLAEGEVYLEGTNIPLSGFVHWGMLTDEARDRIVAAQRLRVAGEYDDFEETGDMFMEHMEF